MAVYGVGVGGQRGAWLFTLLPLLHAQLPVILPAVNEETESIEVDKRAVGPLHTTCFSAAKLAALGG